MGFVHIYFGQYSLKLATTALCVEHFFFQGYNDSRAEITIQSPERAAKGRRAAEIRRYAIAKHPAITGGDKDTVMTSPSINSRPAGVIRASSSFMTIRGMTDRIFRRLELYDHSIT
jgi:hypothetical protein